MPRLNRYLLPAEKQPPSDAVRRGREASAVPLEGAAAAVAELWQDAA